MRYPLNYLLDTDTASYLMERRPSIVSKAREVGGPGLLSISTITLAELYYGVWIMPEGRRKTKRLNELGGMLGTGMEVTAFLAGAAGVYSEAGATIREAE